MYDQADQCPKCKELQMPIVKKDNRATARCCQKCGFVEELNENAKLDNQRSEGTLRK